MIAWIVNIRLVIKGDFFKNYFYRVFNKSLINKLTNKEKIEFIDEKVDVGYFPGFVLKKEGKSVIKKVNVIKEEIFQMGQ